jgi:hypothetical protein
MNDTCPVGREHHEAIGELKRRVGVVENQISGLLKWVLCTLGAALMSCALLLIELIAG